MTLPATGPLSLSQVNTELGKAANSPISLNDTAVRGLAGAASGSISISQLHGKSNVSFSPSQGSYEDESVTSVSFSLNCTVPAVWTYTRTGIGGTTNIASGGTGTKLIMTVIAPVNANRNATWTVTATAGGKTANWTVRLIAWGRDIA